MNDALLIYLALSIVSAFVFYMIVRDNFTQPNIVFCILLFSFLHILSLYNVFIGFLPGADLDAQTFWKIASKAVEQDRIPPFHIGMQAYILVLYWQIVATVDSLLVIQLFSLIFSAINIFLITRLFLIVGGHRSNIWIIMLLLCLSPSFLLHSTLTLREPLQLLSILSFIYLSIRLKTLWGLYFSAIFLALAIALHQALLIYSVIILILFSFIFIYRNAKNRYYFFLDSAILIGALVVFAPYFIDHVPILSGNTLTDLNKQGIFEHLLAYRRPIELSAADTSHNLTLSFETFGSSMNSMMVNYLYYLFGPIINFRLTIENTVLLWEALIRIIGFSLMLKAILHKKNKHIHLLLVLFYFSITLLWSVGTANDGQAFRHHMLSQWVMYIYIGWHIQNFQPFFRDKLT